MVGYPLYGQFSYGEPELGDIFAIFAELQAGLAMEGFFLRGGIAYGEHYMDEDIVFGNALLEAVELNKGGGPPRIALASSAIEMVRKHLGFYGSVEYAPHYHDLLEDADGTIFLNYLSQAFIAFPDGGVFLDLIDEHKNSVVKGLVEYRGMPGIRAKFEWAARYHNFICHEFAANHPVPSSPDADEEYASACVEAQRLLDYLINIEELAATPSYISLEPIRPYFKNHS